MDRFEVVGDGAFKFSFDNLHSSMDRFEARVWAIRLLSSSIYIPVWIDLKERRSPPWDANKIFTFQYG